jgi:hypothetical protein
MSWKRVVVGLGRFTKRAVGVAALPGLLALPAWAEMGMSPGHFMYPATGFFAKGLTAESSWEQIMKPRDVYMQFPVVNFGNMFVRLSAVCVDGDSLRIADPRIDNGVRVATTQLPGREPAAPWVSGYAAVRTDRLATAEIVVADQAPERPDSAITYPVHVYRVITDVGAGHNEFVYLFDKPWTVPSCGQK